MNNTKVMSRVKLGLAIVLVICLIDDMPYGFYVLAHFAAMIVFGVMAYQYYLVRRQTMMVITGALVILFQPILKIALDRETWQFVDILVAAFLFYLLWKERKR